MIKSLVIYITSFSLLFLIIYFSQDFFLNQLNISVRFSLWDTNLFFAITSFVICAHIKFFSSIKSLQPQLGFIYLPTLFIKGIFLFLKFQSSIFSFEFLTFTEKLNLLIPLFLFLGLEVYFVVKIIAKNEA